MNTAATRTQLQSKQMSHQYTGRVKLDVHSLSALNFAAEFHRTHDLPTSHNVVVRRALRVYRDSLKKLKTDEQWRREATELIRAAKGVI